MYPADWAQIFTRLNYWVTLTNKHTIVQTHTYHVQMFKLSCDNAMEIVLADNTQK